MSDLDIRRHASLELLRPLCISLMKDGTKDNARALCNALEKVDDRIAQEIQQYILFPAHAHLNRRDLPEPLLSELCDLLVAVFKKTTVSAVGMFMDTFNPLMFILTPRVGSKRVILEFEETKTSVIKALVQLFMATQEIVLVEIYTAKFVPALGQLVSVLLSFAELEKSRAVQKVALEALIVVLQRDTQFGKKYRDQLADMFPFCLPGVTIATCRIATGDTKQGHSVIVKAMEVFTAIITLVMQDRSLDKAQTKVEKQITKHKGIVPSSTNKTPGLSVERSEEWVKATANKVKVIIEKLCRLVSSDNWRVRLGLVTLCEQVVALCSRSLNESLSKLLETLVGLINDPYGNVSRKALASLQAFSAASSSGAGGCNSGAAGAGATTLWEILEENLHALTSSLPRQIRMCDEDDKPAIIRLLNGYIQLLGANISCVINSGPHLSRLCLALVQALELDTRDLRIVEERRPPQEADVNRDTSQVWKPRKYFKHFRDETILSGLLQACRQLGKYGNIHILVDHLLDICHSSGTYRLAATLVINEMVLGAGVVGQDGRPEENNDMSPSNVNMELLPDVINLLMDDYLSDESLSLLDNLGKFQSSTSMSCAPSLSTALVVVDPDRSADSQREAVTRNTAVLQICLYMEGLANFAKVLGKDRQEHLIRTLYPLVENLGHENLYISSTAFAALVDVAAAGGYSSLDCLLRENADYLVSSVSLRLRHFLQHRRTPQTLCVMLRHCSSQLLPHVRRSVTQLLDSLDDHYEDDLVLFMPVLIELCSALARWFPSTHQGAQQKDTSLKRDNKLLDPDQLVNFLADYLKTRRTAEGDVSSSSDDEDEMHGSGETTLEDIEREMKARMKKKEEEEEGMDGQEEEKEKEMPPHIVVVKEVFSRVRNLLSTNSGRLRVQALDVITHGFQCLRGHEKELLPQAHQMWAGLRPLFNNHEKFVVIKAVKTLVELTEATGDFMRHRVVKEVFPGLSGFMEKQAQMSKGCHSGYLHTGNFKLQLCLLLSIGPLARNLKLDRNDLDLAARFCVPYLSEAQPPVLQQASVTAFSHFIDLDNDAMWLLLHRLYCPLDLTSPGPSFAPVKFPAACLKQNEYSTNVSVLLKRHYPDERTRLD